MSAGEIVYMYWFTITREQIYCHHVRVKLLNIYTHTQTYSLSLSVSLQTGSLPMLIKDCISLEINFADTKSATGIKFLTFSTYKCLKLISLILTVRATVIALKLQIYRFARTHDKTKVNRERPYVCKQNCIQIQLHYVG